MPSIKSVCAQSFHQLKSFLSPFPPFVQCSALTYGKTVFAHTKCSSHINFIESCLNQRIIPNGFNIKFTANVCESRTDQSNIFENITNTCSRNLMRATLRALRTNSGSLQRRALDIRSQFNTLCIPYNTQRYISNAVRVFNQHIYNFLKDTKSSKYKKLLDNSQNTNSKNANTHQSKLVITIPEDIQLSSAERSVLSRGLSFIPLRHRADFTLTRIDLGYFFRRLRLKAHFHNTPPRPTDDNPFDKFSRVPSTWTPASGQFESLDTFIDKCTKEFNKLKQKPVRHYNLTRQERTALLNLKSRTDIVIKPSDKGGAVVVWRKDLYLQEADRQLSDNTYYSTLHEDTTQTNNNTVKQTIDDLVSQSNLPEEAHGLVNALTRTSKFYLLPKIHKPNNPGRPIISACSCPTENISAYLDSIFAPINTTLPTYIKDTNHALTLFNNFTFDTNASHFIFTMDVQALYTSIPHNDGLMALQFFLDRRDVQQPPTQTIVRLAELVLTLNTFEFHGKFYQQIKGVAMGTKMGPSYACLFVGHLEHLMFQQYQGILPALYKRYIDDIGGAASCPRSDLEHFLEFVGGFHPAIKYTCTISERQLPLLDILLTITDNHISTSVFYKPTDSHCYLTYTSSHSTNTKDSIPYSQFLRLRRLCSSDPDFMHQTDKMVDFFLARGYPSSIVHDARTKVFDIPRSESLISATPKHTNRVPLVLTYHPQNTIVKNIIFKHWSELTNDKTTNAIFSEKPLCAFRRDKNLRDQLVSSTCSVGASTPGTFRCGRNRCNTCPFVHSADVLRGPAGVHRILDNITCTTRNVVYAIHCTQCNMLYIGQTSQRLGDRFVQHLRSIRNDDGQPVARHFNSPGHTNSSASMDLYGLVSCTGSHAGRLNLETRLILKLGTLIPQGMNTRHDVRIP